ncbi:MAG: hypothetical protein MUF20_10155 [Methylotetracoccus sp.]|jgi:hypothetical protein|nr:hypothetical protein [Methylotetracoccus sp.]
MPKYLSDKDASVLRAEGRAKHLPEASRRAVAEIDPHDETHKATMKLLDRLVAGQEMLAGEMAEARRDAAAAMENVSNVMTAAARQAPSPSPPAERIRRWDFSIERDEDGRIKKVVART